MEKDMYFILKNINLSKPGNHFFLDWSLLKIIINHKSIDDMNKIIESVPQNPKILQFQVAFVNTSFFISIRNKKNQSLQITKFVPKCRNFSNKEQLSTQKTSSISPSIIVRLQTPRHFYFEARPPQIIFSAQRSPSCCRSPPPPCSNNIHLRETLVYLHALSSCFASAGAVYIALKPAPPPHDGLSLSY